MNAIQATKHFFEKRAFGVCTFLGEKLQMKTSAIRLFFIYATFLTAGSPIILYMILAFWLKLKDLVFSRRTSVFDL